MNGDRDRNTAALVPKSQMAARLSFFDKTWASKNPIMSRAVTCGIRVMLGNPTRQGLDMRETSRVAVLADRGPEVR